MSAQLKPKPMTSGNRPDHVQTVLVGSVYSYIRVMSGVFESDAKRIEKLYDLPVDLSTSSATAAPRNPFDFIKRSWTS